jgi:hypothetical protein
LQNAIDDLPLKEMQIKQLKKIQNMQELTFEGFPDKCNTRQLYAKPLQQMSPIWVLKTLNIHLPY